MIPIKKNPKKQLEKYSTIFTQIGLVLVLFIVHLFIEFEVKTTQKVAVNEKEKSTEIVVFQNFEYFEKEKPKEKKIEKKLPSKTNLEKIKKVDNKTKIATTKLVLDEPKKTLFDLDSIVTVKEEDDLDDDSHIYDARMFTPVFKGCEGLEGDKNRQCFESKLRRFVQKRFDTEQGLNSGTYRIFSEFVINKQGSIVDIRIRAPKKSLEKEMRRVINSLPKFVPGKQGGKPVNVKYMLPIAFKVD